MSAEGQGIGKLYELAAPDKAESGRAAADVGQKAETGANGAETAKAAGALHGERNAETGAVDRATGMAQNRAEAVQTGRGFAIFVKDAIVGDRVRVELTKVKKHYAFGRVTEILEASPERIEPFCPYQGACGGCAYGTLHYDAQLALKEKQVRDKLTRLGGLSAPKVMPILGMGDTDPEETPFRYRNKASMPVSTGGLLTKKAASSSRYTNRVSDFIVPERMKLWIARIAGCNRSLPWQQRTLCGVSWKKTILPPMIRAGQKG